MSAQNVQDCQQRAFRLAFRITRNQEDAEDAQQEALLKAHRNLNQFEGRALYNVDFTYRYKRSAHVIS